MSYLAKTPDGLLPCPHCGGEAEARDGSSTTPYIRCKSCGCRTGSSRSVDRLKEAWNRRPFNPPADIRDERTATLIYDTVHRDYVCSACGERFESGTYLSVSDRDEVFYREMRFCLSCGTRFKEER